uniref:Uncharacterized protein n=1 Tax=Molossus molossus TaxID=27622 RepID=A0A7J8ER23_MOLMO|nr:hypothetical protein HJG59_008673 [Molossus molossus]
MPMLWAAGAHRPLWCFSTPQVPQVTGWHSPCWVAQASLVPLHPAGPMGGQLDHTIPSQALAFYRSYGLLGRTGFSGAPAPSRTHGQLDGTSPSWARASHCSCELLDCTGLCGTPGPATGGWGVLLPRGAQLLLSFYCRFWEWVSAAGLCFCCLGMDVCSPASVAGGMSQL